MLILLKNTMFLKNKSNKRKKVEKKYITYTKLKI